MKIASMRARMTLGLTLFVATLTAIGGTGLWLRNYAQGRNRDISLLKITTERVGEEVRRSASWEEIAAAVREQNLTTSTGEVELWRLESNGREAGHIGGPSAPSRFSHAPPPPKLIPPLNDPNGWLTQRMSREKETLVIGVAWHKTRSELRSQAFLLLMLELLTSCAAGVGAWILVGRTLSPIERLAAQARQRAGENHDAEGLALQAPSPDREIRNLVSTFNALLDSAAQGAKQRERFHASVSHELRTPLQALSSTLQLALSRPRSPDELSAALKNALAQSDRLTTLTRDLLLLNQLGNKSATTSRESVDVAETCDLALSSLQTPLAKKSLQLHENLCPLEVLAPPSHVEMLCRNLLENAVKYAPDTGTLRVETVTSSDGEPSLIVWNETADLIEDDLSEWFEPFYRPDAARASHIGGNGLGLAICRAICDANGWTLNLEPVGEHGIAGVRAVVRFA